MAQSALPNTHTFANAVKGVIVAEVKQTTMSEHERLMMNLKGDNRRKVERRGKRLTSWEQSVVACS